MRIEATDNNFLVRNSIIRQNLVESGFDSNKLPEFVIGSTIHIDNDTSKELRLIGEIYTDDYGDSVSVQQGQGRSFYVAINRITSVNSLIRKGRNKTKNSGILVDKFMTSSENSILDAVANKITKLL